MSFLWSWKRCLSCYGNGDGEFGKVGDTDIEGGEAEEFGAAFGVAVQDHGGPSTAQLHNLYLAPGYAMEACAQGLTDCLFGGKAAGQARRPHHPSPAALLGLFFGEDAPEE